MTDSKNPTVLFSAFYNGEEKPLDQIWAEIQTKFGLTKTDLGERGGRIIDLYTTPTEYALELALSAKNKLKDQDGWRFTGPFENSVVTLPDKPTFLGALLKKLSDHHRPEGNRTP